MARTPQSSRPASRVHRTSTRVLRRVLPSTLFALALVPWSAVTAPLPAQSTDGAASDTAAFDPNLPWALPASVSGAEITGAVDLLRTTFPTLVVRTDDAGRALFSGAPMVVADDPDRAVDLWWERFGAAVGVLATDRELVSVGELSAGRGSVYAYRFHRGPVATEGGIARVVVRALDGRYAVTHVGAIAALAQPDAEPVVRIAAAAALRAAQVAFAAHAFPDRARPRPEHVTWDAPALVLRPGSLEPDSDRARLAWHVVVHEEGDFDPGAWTVRIDPTDGSVIEVRDERLHVDVEGNVELSVSPAPLPDIPSNPPVVVAQPRIQVSIIGGASVFSEPDGSFVIPHGGSAAVDVEVALVGPWVTIENLAGPEFTLASPVLPPSAGTLLLAASGSETIQAQLNAFHYTDRTHEFYRGYNPTVAPGIDTSLPVRTNFADVCNATYDPTNERMNLFLSGNGCVNSAFSNVIAHEYGHFIVDQLNVPQGAFGEGFGDVVAMLLDDDPIIGREFAGSGSVVRNPIAANVQYPCSPVGSVHFCGQILGATFWRIRENLGSSLGDPDGLELARQLFVDWSLVTLGGQGTSSAHPDTAIEVLTVADDDGSIANGTPQLAEICDAFSAHSITCPVFPPAVFTFPLGLPESVTPGLPTTIRVDITDGTMTTDPATARLEVQSVGSSVVEEFPLSLVGVGAYEGVIPPQGCGGAVLFAVAIDEMGGATTFRAPDPSVSAGFSADSYEFVSVLVDEDLETPVGWSVGAPGDTATTGVWEWGNPIGTAAAPDDDHSPTGVNCFFTDQGSLGGNLGEADVDGGPTTLVSPSFDLTGGGEHVLSYWRWYSNDTGAGPNEDVLRIEISDDDGANWVPLETVGPSGPGTSAGWFRSTFVVESVVAPTDAVRVRFIAADEGNPSLVEAAIDDLLVERRECTPGFEYLRGDLNTDGSWSLGDPILLLGYLFQGGAIGCDDAGDTNDDGTMNLPDVITLLTYLFVDGTPLPEPFVSCGVDPTDDALECASSACP